jgi:hypothetical protein
MAGSWFTACILALVTPVMASAEATVFLCEPYGRYGRLAPQGHIAIYFDRVCADSPTRLRRCEPGEVGVVVSRYSGIAGLDWVAMPLFPWLYAVESAADVPAVADHAQVAALRNAYREAHLRPLAPDAPGGRPPKGSWYQLIGAAYDRRIVAFTIRTTAEQDDELIRMMNGRPNRSRWNFALHNCADFVQDVLNFYNPGSIKTSAIADLGLTTPKQVAKCLVKFGERRESLELRTFLIARIPGSRRESSSSKGVLESLVKKPFYVVPLALVEPWLPAALVAGYVVTGRFNPRKHANTAYDPALVDGWSTSTVLGTMPSPDPVLPAAHDHHPGSHPSTPLR